MNPAPSNGDPPEETSPESSEPIEANEANTPQPPRGFPVTFSGVASFAQTGWGRLLGWQWMMALALGGAVLIVLARHWAPVLDTAVQRMPATTGWQNGALLWPDDTPVELGRTPYFCLIVDPEGTARAGQLADVQLELRREDWLLGSMLGYLELPYAPGDLPLAQAELAPWWGARRPFLLGTLSAAAGVLAWLASLGLGLAGSVVARTVAYYVDRQCTLGDGWRLAAAAQLPAALLLSVGVLCYGLGLLPWMGLLVLGPVALLVAWVYLFFAPFFLPALEPTGENPFEDSEPDDDDEDASPAEAAEGNPFHESAEEDSAG